VDSDHLVVNEELSLFTWQGGDNYAVHYNLGLAFFFQNRFLFLVFVDDDV